MSNAKPIFGKGMRRSTFRWKRKGFSVKRGEAIQWMSGSVKRSGPFSEPPDSENWKVAVIYLCLWLLLCLAMRHSLVRPSAPAIAFHPPVRAPVSKDDQTSESCSVMNFRKVAVLIPFPKRNQLSIRIIFPPPTPKSADFTFWIWLRKRSPY